MTPVTRATLLIIPGDKLMIGHTMNELSYDGIDLDRQYGPWKYPLKDRIGRYMRPSRTPPVAQRALALGPAGRSALDPGAGGDAVP